MGLKFENFSMIYTVLTDDGKVIIEPKYDNRDLEENIAYGLEWVRAFNEFNLNDYKSLPDYLFKILKDDYKRLKKIVDEWISLMKNAKRYSQNTIKQLCLIVGFTTLLLYTMLAFNYNGVKMMQREPLF